MDFRFFNTTGAPSSSTMTSPEILTIRQRDEVDLLRSSPTTCSLGLLFDEMKYTIAVVANITRQCQFSDKLATWWVKPTAY